MVHHSALHRMVDRLCDLPVLQPVRRQRFNRRFEAGQMVGCCRGVYDTFAQAAAAAPATRPLGYDHEAAAGMYHDRLETVYPGDYPMMFWLQKAFGQGARQVFDLGGHIGVSYYAYQRAVDFPATCRWTVHDVKAVVSAGRSEALLRDPSGRLSFTDHFEDAAQADLLFTSGCIQYLEQTLAQRLAALPQRPRWLSVNWLPLHDKWAYWTVQSIGTSFCPYRIQHRQTFFDELAALGYRVLDEWPNLEKDCWIAFHPQHSLTQYHGAALQLD